MRRVFASTSSAPAYSYDPYGNALQGTAPLSDAVPGLRSGFWAVVSRDPLGEIGDPAANLSRGRSSDRRGTMDSTFAPAKFGVSSFPSAIPPSADPSPRFRLFSSQSC